MDAGDNGQSPRHRAETALFVPRIQRKPALPNESSYPLISLSESNMNHECLNAPIQQPNNPGIHTQSFRHLKSPRFSGKWKKHFTRQQNWWLFEMLAAAISIAAMVSLLGVLYRYNNTVVQNLPLGITLNGVVAVLSTICRAALMIPVASCLSQAKWLWFSPNKKIPSGRRLKDLATFDSASRGSWGSLQLLWTLKAGHIASIGALVTIFSLAFDAFSQQVLSSQYSSILLPNIDNTTLQIARSENYTLQNNENNEALRVPDWPTYAAIYNGILANNISYLPVPCTTGNCTYPIIPSLGVCGGCHPLTWTAPSNCTGHWNSGTSNTGPCNFTLPDGQHISVTPSDTVNVFQIMSTKGTYYNASSTTTPYIANFEAIGMPFNLKDWNSTLLAASECALWYCVQVYSITVNSNVLTQSVVDTWNTVDKTPSASGYNGNSKITFTQIPEHFNVNPNSSFFVGALSMNAASEVLYDVFKGNAEAGEGMAFTGAWTEAVWDGWGDGSGIQGLVENLAKSMTNNIRDTSSAPPSDAYTGQAYREKLFVQVRWAWMILPIALVVFSTLFLVETILEMRGNRVKAWKSGALALLFSDVDKEVKSASQNAFDTVNGLADIGGKSRVVLREDNGYWAFK